MSKYKRGFVSEIKNEPEIIKLQPHANKSNVHTRKKNDDVSILSKIVVSLGKKLCFFAILFLEIIGTLTIILPDMRNMMILKIIDSIKYIPF